jgi:NADH-quinone oxidoreductase subunit N
MASPFFNATDYAAIKPEILVTLFGLAVLLFDYLLDKRDKYLNAVLALIGLGFALLQFGIFWFGRFSSGGPAYVGFNGSFAFDSFAVVTKTVIVLATAIVVLLSVKYLDIEESNQGEYYALLLFAAVGMMFMVSGTDLIVLFIALEVMALCEYVLTGFLRGNRRSNEAAVKFFLLGACRSFTESGDPLNWPSLRSACATGRPPTLSPGLP